MSTEEQAPVVFDVDEANFERLVLERSRSVPVLVDFWAPWCGPCRTLSPLLEEMARAAGGRWVLAKVDTDANPTLSQHFGIRGIPNVKAIVDGRFQDEFTGALPRAEIEAFLARILPSPEDEQVSQAAELVADGDLAAARTVLEAVLATQPRHEGANLSLAEVAASEGSVEEAERLLANTIEAGPLAERIRALRARLHFDAGEGEGSLDALKSAIETAPDDLGARLDLGRAAARVGEHELAGECFLFVMERDRGFRDGEAGSSLRDLLTLMGEAHPRTSDFRNRMASLLFA